MSLPNLIPVMKPSLPTADKILPYLREIDKNNWYSNFGPLVERLEARFEEILQLPAGSVLTLASGAMGLTNALRAWNLMRGSYCIVPAWTFIGTAASACAAELTPYFVDVDKESWAIDPEALRKQLPYIPGKVSAVIVVSPFGRPLDTKAWEKFMLETGIKVIIDAAASFDAVHTEKLMEVGEHVPVMVSLHATKTLGIGEGGLLLCKNTKFIKRVQEMSNFGFSDLESDAILVPGTNGKMSEYAAAVGHAALDEWTSKREAWKIRRDWYRARLQGLPVKPHMVGDWVSSTYSLELERGMADELLKKMRDRGIECRKWWRNGCHRQVAYGEFPRLPLPITDELARTMIALPFRVLQEESEVDFVVKQLKECL